MEKVGGAGLHECHRRFLSQNDCDSSPLDQQSILMKDHFMGTAKIVCNTDFLLSVQQAPLRKR